MPKGFYQPYNWTNMQQAQDLRKLGRAADAALVEKVARFGITNWLTGTKYDLSGLRMILYGGDKEKGSTKTGQIPVVALYNIPHRDCGYYSAGGVSAPQYRAWIDSISRIIKTSRIALILEPDGINVTSCLSAAQKTERWSLIRYAAQTFKTRNPGAVVYIAAHASKWGVDQSANNLKAAGVELTRGLTLNVADFQWTKDAIAHAEGYRAKLGLDLHYVIDTSRNGKGPVINPKNNEAAWCNPAGRAFGSPSTTRTGHPRVDAFLWIKGAGTDGDCWKSQHFEHSYDYILQMAHNTWG